MDRADTGGCRDDGIPKHPLHYDHAPRLCGLAIAPRGVGPARRCHPDEDPWFGLFEPPALGMFDAMMIATQRPKVALATAAAPVERLGVVAVAALCGHTAAWRRAPRVPDLYQMPE